MDLLGRARIKILSARINLAKMFCDCFFFYFSLFSFFSFFFSLFIYFFLNLIHGDNRTTSKKDGNAAQKDPKQPHN